MKPISVACDSLEQALRLIRWEMTASLCIDENGYYLEVWS